MAFLARLFAAAELPLAPYRLAPLLRQVPACMDALGAASIDRAAAAVAADPRSREVALDAILLGVTEFFRGAEVFEALALRLIPPERPVRAWSVACSDGAELASLGIVLHEAGALGGARLLGTDVRSTAIAAARRGVYPLRALRALTPARAMAHFEQAAGGARLVPPVRDALRFACADALACADACAWDLILCRNLAIYLEPFAADRLWRRLHRALRPGGVLMVGKAEHPDGVVLERVGPCLFRKA